MSRVSAVLARLRLFICAEHAHLIFSLVGLRLILTGYRAMTASPVGPSSNNSIRGQGVRGTGPRINAAFLSDALCAGSSKVFPAKDSTAEDGKHEAANEKLQPVGGEPEPSEHSVGEDFTDVNLADDDEAKLVNKV